MSKIDNTNHATFMVDGKSRNCTVCFTEKSSTKNTEFWSTKNTELWSTKAQNLEVGEISVLMGRRFFSGRRNFCAQNWEVGKKSVPPIPCILVDEISLNVVD